MLRVDLAEVRKEAEAFSRELAREHYESYAGLKDSLETAKVFTRHEEIFTPEVILRLKELRAGAEGEEERRLRYLQAMITDGYLGNAVKDLSDRVATEEARRTVEVGDETLPFRLAAVRMTQEDDRARRKTIFDARNRVVEDLNLTLAERMDTLHTLARDLGYDHYMHLYSDIKGLDLPGLRSMLGRLLAATERMYADEMGDALSKIDLSLGAAERFDIAYLFRGKEFDPHFPKEKAVDTLRATLKGMGLDFDRKKAIRIDVEERPQKSPRAFCSPVDVPREVYLVAMPHGGHDDYRTILHEAGHAWHFASCKASLPFEFRYLGDNSVTEGMAFVLEAAMEYRAWLRRYAPGLDAEAYLRFSALHKLHFLRRYTGKLAYEAQLHTLGVEGMGPEYARSLEETLVYRHPPEHYLVDLDDGFYAAQYLRAWLFEAQMRSALEEKFGDAWYASRAAGRFLRDLWSEGQKHDVVEILRAVGFGGLEVDPLIERIQDSLA